MYEGQRFDLRFFRPLSIRKSSSVFPPLMAATSQRGFAPRPAQVSPEGPPIFRRDFFALQNACTASDNPSATDPGNPLQLSFDFGPLLKKPFVNTPSQVH